jgi:hypothetical protein
VRGKKHSLSPAERSEISRGEGRVRGKKHSLSPAERSEISRGEEIRCT